MDHGTWTPPAPDGTNPAPGFYPGTPVHHQHGLPQPSAAPYAQAVDGLAQPNEQQPLVFLAPYTDGTRPVDPSGAARGGSSAKKKVVPRGDPIEEIQKLWGMHIVHFYEMKHLSRRLLAVLHAVAMEWTWQDFVPAINRALFARHENVRRARVQGRFPVTVADLSTLPPVDSDAPPRPPSPVRRAAPLGLGYDKHGLLVQAGLGPGPEGPSEMEQAAILLSLAANCRVENIRNGSGQA